MAITIPIVPDSPDFDFTVELDGETFALHLQFNERDGAWYVDILTAEDDPIVMGRKVVLDLPLFGRYRDERLPVGQLVAVDTSGLQIEPAYGDLGRRVQLVYTTAAELAAL